MTEDIRLKTNRGLIVGTDKFIKKTGDSIESFVEVFKTGEAKKR